MTLPATLTKRLDDLERARLPGPQHPAFMDERFLKARQQAMIETWPDMERDCEALSPGEIQRRSWYSGFGRRLRELVTGGP